MANSANATSAANARATGHSSFQNSGYGDFIDGQSWGFHDSKSDSNRSVSSFNGINMFSLTQVFFCLVYYYRLLAFIALVFSRRTNIFPDDRREYEDVHFSMSLLQSMMDWFRLQTMEWTNIEYSLQRCLFLKTKNIYVIFYFVFVSSRGINRVEGRYRRIWRYWRRGATIFRRVWYRIQTNGSHADAPFW